jgi:non-heme chloroperoxidase
MDHYATDAAAVVEHLDLRNAIHVSHSTGGGEAVRDVARYDWDRVAQVLIGAVPPLLLKTEANPGGLPIEVFDGLRKQLAANRSHSSSRAVHSAAITARRQSIASGHLELGAL